MPYGQINYSEKLGTGPTSDTIADVGCFLAAFCNLLERFGESIDPPTLNNYFIEHHTYLPDGPDFDNLGWGSVSAYDGNVVSTGQGSGGWPPSNDSIVKFIYKSQRTGQSVTHFCLVVDRSAGTILDSWDGRVKYTPYGNPVAWSTYERHTAQIVSSPPPPETQAFTIENISLKTEQLNKNTNLWDMNQRSWPGLVNNPVSAASAGFKFQTSQIAHQIMGGSYYLPSGNNSQGYNIVDCEDAAPEVPTPPTSLPTGAINLPSGRTYDVITPIKGYRTATQAGNHDNPFSDVEPGNYFVFNIYPTREDLINVTHTNGMPGAWINTSDNVEPVPTPPPAPEPEVVIAPEPVVEIAPVEPEPVVAVPWQDTFKPFPKPVHYISTRSLSIADLSGVGPNIPLGRYNPGSTDNVGVVSAFGNVTKDDIEYYRLKTNNDPGYKLWYCVAKIDPDTHTPNLLVKPIDPGTPIGKVNMARDTLQLAKAHFEFDAIKFLDDMVPKFLKKPKK